jgi:hypothetical protein
MREQRGALVGVQADALGTSLEKEWQRVRAESRQCKGEAAHVRQCGVKEAVALVRATFMLEELMQRLERPTASDGLLDRTQSS